MAGEITEMNTGSMVKVLETDVTDATSVAITLERAEAECGSLDVLVNNVGWTVDRLFLEKLRQEWEKEVQVNIWGAINCVHAVVPGMI